MTQVLLSLTLHFGHDFGTIKEEEESTGLVCNSLGNESLTGAGRSEKEHTLGRLDTESLEKLRMTQGELDHFTNLGELLAHATNIVIADIFSLLFIVTVDGVTFVEKCGLGGDNAVLGRVHVDNLELDGAEATTHDEGIALLDGAVAVLEVGDKVGLRDVARDAFYRVSKR